MKFSRLILILGLFSLEMIEGSGHKFTGQTLDRHEEALEIFDSDGTDKVHNFIKRKYLFGDWPGIRTATSTWTTDLLGNPIGGNSQAFTNFGAAGIDFVVNLEKYGHQGRMPGCLARKQVLYFKNKKLRMWHYETP